jgi:hypothetical protein
MIREGESDQNHVAEKLNKVSQTHANGVLVYTGS